MIENIKAFWYLSKNFGDTLTPVLVKHFTGRGVEYTEERKSGKLIGVGSIISAIKENDVVWGAGAIRAGHPKSIKQPNGSWFLAVRGPLTHELIDGDVPEIYGDPAILLPLVYRPDVKITHKMGILPHYADYKDVAKKEPVHGVKLIDICSSWQNVIREILSCDLVVTSSLHGIVTANAYGVPVQWVKYSNKIIGGEFKFQDYFAGVGIPPQKYGDLIPDIVDLASKQKRLIKALKDYYHD